MMFRMICLFCVFAAGFFSNLFCEEGVTVIIPCYHKHFHFLGTLLEEYTHQTQLPDEIVIALSDVKKIPPTDLNDFEAKTWPFSIKVIKNTEAKTAGQNRNIACENASYDIIICQDADDLPHPQRVEIMSYIFHSFDVDHIIHRWIKDDEGWDSYLLDQLLIYPINSAVDLQKYSELQYGAIGFRKSVWKKIKWPRKRFREDLIFNLECIRRINKTVVLDAYLLIYRPQFSSIGGTRNYNKLGKL